MKIGLTKSDPGRGADAERRWPGYLFGGRVRTSTVVLIVAFVLVAWVYQTYRPVPEPPAAPQVVPPGFIPDPDYTWVPRTRLQQPRATVTETRPPSTVTETVTPVPPETSEPAPWPFCPPLCPPAPPPPAEPAPGLPPGAPTPGAPAPPPGAATPVPAPPPGAAAPEPPRGPAGLPGRSAPHG